jgi:hypothetical protein
MSDAAGRESKSYRDPLGAHMDAARSAWQAYKQKFPPVASVYDACYLDVAPLADDKDASAFFLGPEGIIGTSVLVEDALLKANNGRVVARLDDASATRLRHHRSEGWQVNVVLALVLYHNESKSPSGQLACICYDPGLAGSLDPFTKNIIFRISKGEHPQLALTQEQFIRVLESKGAWYLTKAEPLPPRPKGTVIYKKRRSWSENLVEMALKGNVGCRIANVVFWLLAAVAVLGLVWWFFFRG